MATCCVCGVVLPNKWAVARRETANGAERCYCHLHANGYFGGKPDLKGEKMDETRRAASSAQEEEIAKAASGDRVKKAWSECAALAGKLGGGIKSLWAKIHPDRSPAATLATLNESLEGNKARLGEMKPELDRIYREIVAKKKEYQAAAPVRQRLLKIELQTLMARYKGLEREFSILCENERSIETVKGRFLEVLAYGMRGKLDAGMVERLTESIEDKVDDAEDVQDALGDLERAGKRTDRAADDFDAELAGFDGELDLTENDKLPSQKENNNENVEINGGMHGNGAVADAECGIA